MSCRAPSSARSSFCPKITDFGVFGACAERLEQGAGTRGSPRGRVLARALPGGAGTPPPGPSGAPPVPPGGPARSPPFPHPLPPCPASLAAQCPARPLAAPKRRPSPSQSAPRLLVSARPAMQEAGGQPLPRSGRLRGRRRRLPATAGTKRAAGGLRRRCVFPAPQPRPGAARRLMGVVVPTSARPRPRLPARTTAPGTPRGPPPNRGARCCGGAAAAEAPSQDGGRQ